MLKIKAIIVVLALIFTVNSALASTQVLRSDFTISSNGTYAANQPKIIETAQARTYSTAPKKINLFSGWYLLTASLSLSFVSGFLLWKFVNQEEQLIKDS